MQVVMRAWWAFGWDGMGLGLGMGMGGRADGGGGRIMGRAWKSLEPSAPW